MVRNGYGLAITAHERKLKKDIFLGLQVSQLGVEIVSKCGARKRTPGPMFLTTLTAEFIRHILDISAREPRHL